ncbi:MAG: GNAT family N-acetyltransferase [Atopobiaceae bacterium]|jgi:ribosomal protein S18 acetylase RimI-like enzyme
MQIRRARIEDIDEIVPLLHQVHDVHAQARPDIFVRGSRKYTTEELKEIIPDDTRPVFVAVQDLSGKETVVGHAFCIWQDTKGIANMQDVTTLYLDDLCVDSAFRKEHIGTALYEYVLDYAKSHGAYRVTLNVWSSNPSALHFYEHLGLVPYHIGMEKIL